MKKTCHYIIAFALALLPMCKAHAQQEALFIYQTDEEFDAFLFSDVDSIVYSCIGLDSLLYDEPVVQEVYSPMGVRRIPIANVDSIMFQAPPTVYKDNVFHLTEAHLPYIQKAEDTMLTFDISTPANLIPEEDQIIVSDIWKEPIPDGFAGRVIAVVNMGYKIDVYCEPVGLSEVFDQIVYVGKSVSSPDNPEASARILRDKEYSGSLKMFDIGNVKGKVGDGPFSFSVDYHPEISFDYYVKKLSGHFLPVISTTLHGTHQIDVNIDCEFDAANLAEDILKPKEPKWFKSFDIPTDVPGLFFYVDLGGYYQLSGKAAISGKFPITLCHHTKFYFDWLEKRPNLELSNTTEGSQFGKPVASIGLKGSIDLGLAMQIGMGMISKRVLSADVTAKLGPKFSASFELEKDGLLDNSWYSAIKESKVSADLVADFSGGYTIFGENGNYEDLKFPLRLSKKWNLAKWYLMPEFTTPSISYIDDSDPNNVCMNLNTTASRNLLLPVHLGLGLYDESGNLIDKQFSEQNYQGESDERKFSWPFKGLEYQKKYKATPLFQLMGTEVSARPEAVVWSQGLKASSNSVQLKAGRSQTISLSGSTGVYQIENSREDVAQCYVVGTKLTINALSAGRATVKVKAKGSDETVMVIVTVTGSINSAEDGNPLTANTGSDILDKLVADMVYVSAGQFAMGATSEQAGASQDNEYPMHVVTLSPYYINKFELTQDIWQEVMGSNPSRYQGDKRPVTNVSWEETQTFLEELSARTGYSFRLPTEAEWEFAARGGNDSQGYKYAGSNNVSDVFSGQGSWQHTSVGRKEPNELGLYDMSGNVWEYCSDVFNDFAYGPLEDTNPKGPVYGENHTVRGGGADYYSNGSGDGRVSRRAGSNGGDNVGFRIAYSPKENVEPSEIEKLANSMVDVPTGTFTMGATEEQTGSAQDNEQPPHPVKLSPYKISKTEVTQNLWYLIMGDNPSRYKGATRPVTNVNMEQVKEFIARLNAQSTQVYRLPTEAEWELAARGGYPVSNFKYAGSDNVSEVFSAQGSWQPTSIGRKEPNSLGIYDMSGNAWEYCGDLYNDFAYDRELTKNPKGPLMGNSFSVRGGGADYYSNGSGDGRVSRRTGSNGGDNVGFRLVTSTTEPVGETEIQRLINDMVLVQGGTFTMGSNDYNDNEKPAHPVTVSSFFISKFEVTQNLWKYVMETEPARYKGAKRPVTNVSWDDVQEFISRLNDLTGGNFRLPTEAEWEFAATGGKNSNGFKYAGSDNVDEVFSAQGSWQPTSVGRKTANELGLYDMSGNVWEYCNDWYNAFAYDREHVSNPQGPATGSEHVVRGGGADYYSNGSNDGRITRRGSSNGGDNVGFRLACTSLSANNR